MNDSLDARYARFVAELREQWHLGSARALLGWDQDTMMPRGALSARAAQLGALSVTLHARRTAPGFLDLVDGLAADAGRLDAGAAADVRETKWRLDRERALEPTLVRARAELQAEARAAWVEARRDDDFAALAPYLERLFGLAREAAAAIAPDRDAYEVLLEGYERHATRDRVAALLGELAAGLAPIIERLHARLARGPLGGSALTGEFPPRAQRRFNRRVIETLGFDFARGRLDESAHPFTATVGDDVRLTTRYDERDLRVGLYSSIHETGHGLYEQGLPRDALGLPRGSACSLGVHESQSRLWENVIARSEAFWRCWHPRLAEHFPALGNRPLEAVLMAVNEARPSLIRVEADEITYNLHIVMRFELECALLDGTLAVADLPAAWRERSRHYLGVAPAGHREGVLQDVHWACGDVGYFPTYAIGNVYAAQLWQAARRALGDVDALLAAGDYRPLIDWLGREIYRHGQRLAPDALIEQACGEPVSVSPLLAHLEGKMRWLEAV